MNFTIKRKIIVVFFIIIFANILFLTVSNVRINDMRVISGEIFSHREDIDVLNQQFFSFYRLENSVDLFLLVGSVELKESILSELDIIQKNNDMLSDRLESEEYEAMNFATKELRTYIMVLLGDEGAEKFNYNFLVKETYYEISESLELIRNVLSEKNGLLSVASMNQNKILDELLRILYISEVIIVLISFLSVFLLERILLLPIGKLLDATSRITKGNLNFRVKIKSRDEFGEVAKSFNSMTLELKRGRKKLADYNKNLEKEVRKRTKQYEEKNRALEKFNNLVVGRELKMVELKKKLDQYDRELKNGKRQKKI